MTRIAILSDIHANVLALDAVRTRLRRTQAVDAVWVLGDVLGYGPHPVAAWELLRRQVRPSIRLAGNHEWYIAGRLNGPRYIELADGTTRERLNGPRESAWWVVKAHRRDCTRAILTALEDLESHRRPMTNVFLAHAVYDPRPEAEEATFVEYRLEQPEDLEPFYTMPEAEWHDLPDDRPVLHIAGHTHIPALWVRDRAGGPESWTVLPVEYDVEYALEPDLFYHLNPGSVGFPRDPALCPGWALLDTGRWVVSFHQTPYDSEAVRADMHDRGYPEDLYSERQLKVCPCADDPA